MVRWVPVIWLPHPSGRAFLSRHRCRSLPALSRYQGDDDSIPHVSSDEVGGIKQREAVDRKSVYRQRQFHVFAKELKENCRLPLDFCTQYPRESSRSRAFLSCIRNTSRASARHCVLTAFQSDHSFLIPLYCFRLASSRSNGLGSANCT